MTRPVDNRRATDYDELLRRIARAIAGWSGPVVIATHVDPDGDALGSSLALGRALAQLGKEVTLPVTPPAFLEFLTEPGELSGPLERLPDGALLVLLDSADEARVADAPLAGAAFTINIDHHGTNDRFGDLALVDPTKAATAQLVKDLIEELGVRWDARIATPCLTGIITDTGSFRFANTTPRVLEDAAELISYGVDYPVLADRLQWRQPSYFTLLGKVMSTVEFDLDGLVVMASMTAEDGLEDDSDDFVGLIRYAAGTVVAAFLRERDDGVTKVSVRSRDGVSAQAICLELGGGGHVPAAGARVAAGLEETRRLFLAAARRELERKGLLAGG